MKDQYAPTEEKAHFFPEENEFKGFFAPILGVLVLGYIFLQYLGAIMKHGNLKNFNSMWSFLFTINLLAILGLFILFYIKL